MTTNDKIKIRKIVYNLNGIPWTSKVRKNPITSSRIYEHIRNYTDQPATDEMVDAILKDTTHLNRDDLKEALYGLSIDKVLMFNDPGTLNTWDNTALHMTKPFFINPYSGIVGVNQESRLCLQYETVEKWIKI